MDEVSFLEQLWVETFNIESKWIITAIFSTTLEILKFL